MEKCCWNCSHCCTFSGVCFKDKWTAFKGTTCKIKLEEYVCEEFEDNKEELI